MHPNCVFRKVTAYMLKEYDRGAKKKTRGKKKAVTFIKQKNMMPPKWFMDAIKQRQHTLLSTWTAIMNHQYDFLWPANEKLRADHDFKKTSRKTGLDISNSKAG